MAVERERGISVSSAVMSFEHEGLAFNLLNTPGHQDFSEDTYRTLTAVGSAVMVLDAAKGIEEQTCPRLGYCTFSSLGKWVTVPLALIPSKRWRSQSPTGSLIKTSHVMIVAAALIFVASTEFPCGGENRTDFTAPKFCPGILIR
jgi:hypothetical protein